jgi:hypothetical protein
MATTKIPILMSTSDDPDPDGEDDSETETERAHATIEDVRQNLHIEDWDSVGVPDSQIEYYLDRRALPFVAEELGDEDLAEWRFVQIEALLAAHWMATSNDSTLRQARREGAADGSYAWLTGPGEDSDGLRATTMGQSAVGLDPTGTLASLADRDSDAREFVFEMF